MGRRQIRRGDYQQGRVVTVARNSRIMAAVVVVAALVAAASSVRAQDNETCLMCHGNGAMFAGSPDSARLHISVVHDATCR